MTIQTHIQTWGNSLAVRIPKTIAKKLLLTHGTVVTLDDAREILTVLPTRTKRLTTKQRVARITPKNLHIDEAWDTMVPVGSEVW